MGYYKPCTRDIKPGQRFGANPGWGPNPPGGHNGNDELAPVGTPVHAAGDGVVIFAGEFDSTYADNFGWNLNFGGKMVVLNLDGAEGPYVEYGHNSELRVKTGDRVRAAQVIALSGESDGNTGVITGPHVHVGCLPPNFDLNTPTYGRVNPDTYLTEWPEDTGDISYASESITPLEEDMGHVDTISDTAAETIAAKLLAAQVQREGQPAGQTNTLGWSLGAEAPRTEGIIARTAEAAATAVLFTKFPRQGPGQTGETDLASIISWWDYGTQHAGSATPHDAPAIDPEQIKASISAAVGEALRNVDLTFTISKQGQEPTA